MKDKRYVVFNIGCIECGVSSNLVGIFSHKNEAQKIADKFAKKFAGREDGQNAFEVFEVGELNKIDPEYLTLSSEGSESEPWNF